MLVPLMTPDDIGNGASQEVARVLVPLIKFQYMDDVRTAAMMAMPELLQASVLALKTGVPEASEAFVHQLKEFMYTPMVDQARTAPYQFTKFLIK